MALIQCPTCGGTISDRAQKCVHCGTDITTEPVIQKPSCPECGLEIDENVSVCPQCGCPLNNNEIKEDVSLPKDFSTNKNKKKRIIIICAIIAFVLAVGAVILGVCIQKQQEAAKISQENAEKEAAQIIKNYEEMYSQAVKTMYVGSDDAETCGNLIAEVWYNSIFKKEDERTDKYTQPDGYFLDEFGDALDNLFDDYNFILKINSISSNQQKVQKLMKELKNPPESCEKSYDALMRLYEAYIGLTNVVIDPTGSYKEFSGSLNDAIIETNRAFKAVESYTN